MSYEKTPEQAARLAEERAKAAREKFEEKTHELRHCLEEEDWRLLREDGDRGLGRVAARILRDFAYHPSMKCLVEYDPELGVFQEDQAAQAAETLWENLVPPVRERIQHLKESSNSSEDKTERARLEYGIKTYDRVVKRLSTNAGQKEVLELAAKGKSGSLFVPADRFDANPWHLHCRGRVLDLRTGTDRPSMPEDYGMHYSSVPWKGIHAECPKFMDFLHSSLDNNEEVIDFLQRATGAAITGIPSREVIFLYGAHGWNGKSIFADTLDTALGSYSYALPSKYLMEMKGAAGTGPTPELVELNGRRFVTSSETKQGGQMDVAQVKFLSGGDKITARGLYGKVQSFAPSHSLIILTNHMPRSGTGEEAFIERCRIVSFPFMFVDNPDPKKSYQRKRDPLLKEAITTEDELAGILAWAVRGAMQWYADGQVLHAPTSVTEAVKRYAVSEDTIEAFTEARCELDPQAITKALDLYEAYVSWHDEENGEDAAHFGKKGFYKLLDARFNRIDRQSDSSRKAVHYMGIRLT